MKKCMVLMVLMLSAGVCQSEWKPVEGRIMTRWAQDVSPDNPPAEYPRPMMVRDDWKSLNGLWDYAVVHRTAERPTTFDGKILVPFPIESALSGVGKTVGAADRLWYRRTFEAPDEWTDNRVLLHFGAVDWETDVWVNGQYVGSHRGGHGPFSFDITVALHRAGRQEIVVAVWDPTDEGFQPRGKQTHNPRGIWYTAVTGIWQTVWLEPIARTAIGGLKITPDIDRNRVSIDVSVLGDASGTSIRAIASGQGKTITADSFDGSVELAIAAPRLWSPDDPYLYDLVVQLRKGDTVIDEVSSYFGMRKIALQKDAAGVNRLFLNNEPLFQYGLLDQGWWPDGLYAAPTDEALRVDVEMTKQMGFNMLRKHVKVEPQRLYYWCDKIGVLVWQDMPSGEKTIRWDQDDLNRSVNSATQFEREYREMIESFYNHPSIVVWVPFNEGWGQFDTERITEWARRLDPTRLIVSPSGWTDRNVGDMYDIHSYPGPSMPPLEPNRAAVLGEFGGLGLPMSGHTWQDEGAWGYQSYATPQELTEAYADLIDKLRILVGKGLAAAVYTQTTDVEIEVNGLMTYDRAVMKIAPETLAALHEPLYGTPPTVRTLLPHAKQGRFVWSYTTAQPQTGWYLPDFDDSGWQTGVGGFGTEGAISAIVGTVWQTPEIWLRREFDLDRDDFGDVLLSIHRNRDDAVVYINGVRAATLTGRHDHYNIEPVSDAAKAALRRGTNVIAVHCKYVARGHYIDVGLIEAEK